MEGLPRSSACSQQYMDALAAFQAEEAANSRKRKPVGEATEQAPQEKKSEATALVEKAEILALSSPDESNLNNARKLYEEAARLGHAKAALMAGKIFLSTSLEDKTQKAMQYFTLGLNKTDGEAEWLLSELYNVEEFGMLNRKEVEKFLIEGSRQKHSRCLYGLASIYMKSDPTSEIYKDGYNCLFKAANQGYAKAQAKLGKLKYLEAGVVAQCFFEAREWFEKGVAQNNNNAKAYLGLMYIEGQGGEQQLEKGLGLLHSVNRLDTYKYLASTYIFGLNGVEINQKEGILYLKKAAEKGSQWAYYQWGLLLLSMSTSSPEDKQEGIKYLEKVQGAYKVIAKANLADFYLKQKTVEGENKALELHEELLVDPATDDELKNKIKIWLAQAYLNRGMKFAQEGEEYKKLAFENFYKAAHYENIDGFYFLGRCYRKGFGVEKNLQEAFLWNIKAADQGSKIAKLYAGIDYYYGRNDQNFVNLELSANYLRESESEKAYYYMGLVLLKKIKELEETLWMLIIKDETLNRIEELKHTTKECMEEADKIGDSRATLSLGNMYFKGEIIGQNLTLALTYFTKAANLGNQEARLIIYMMYQFGIGVDKNPEEAKRYLNSY